MMTLRPRSKIERLVGVLAALVALAAPTAALACRCRPLAPAVAYRRAAAVVLAQADAIVDTGTMRPGYRLTVSESWKQRQPAHIVVRTGATSCGQDLTIGQRYLLYLDATKDGLSTGHCRGNLPLEDAGPALRMLRQGR